MLQREREGVRVSGGKEGDHNWPWTAVGAHGRRSRAWGDRTVRVLEDLVGPVTCQSQGDTRPGVNVQGKSGLGHKGQERQGPRQLDE